jgi:hypothetical protein
MKIIKYTKYLAFVFLASCSTLYEAPENKKYLLREFNDNGELVQEVLTDSYRMKFERLTYIKNGEEFDIGENFEIRQLNK